MKHLIEGTLEDQRLLRSGDKTTEVKRVEIFPDPSLQLCDTRRMHLSHPLYGLIDTAVVLLDVDGRELGTFLGIQLLVEFLDYQAVEPAETLHHLAQVQLGEDVAQLLLVDPDVVAKGHQQGISVALQLHLDLELSYQHQYRCLQQQLLTLHTDLLLTAVVPNQIGPLLSHLHEFKWQIRCVHHRQRQNLLVT